MAPLTVQLPPLIEEVLGMHATRRCLETYGTGSWRLRTTAERHSASFESTPMDRIDRARAEQNQNQVDANWITERIALGGWIETPEKMQDVAHAGITHILNMSWEFDETRLAAPYRISVFRNHVDDDFAPKSPEV